MLRGWNVNDETSLFRDMENNLFVCIFEKSFGFCFKEKVIWSHCGGTIGGTLDFRKYVFI